MIRRYLSRVRKCAKAGTIAAREKEREGERGRERERERERESEGDIIFNVW